MAKKLKVTQVKSTIGTLDGHKRTIRALGLGKINRIVTHEDNAAIRGMIYNVRHLIKVEEVDGE